MNKVPYLQMSKAFPVINILHQSGDLLRLMYLHSNHLKCIVYITNYVDMDQHIVTCSLYYGIIECFHCPQNHLYSVRPLPHTLPLATTNHFMSP